MNSDEKEHELVIPPIHNGYGPFDTEFELDELPEDQNEIIEFLKDQKPPLTYWLEIAREYYRKSMIMQCQGVLLASSQPDVEALYPGSENRKVRLKLLNMLGGLYAMMFLESCSGEDYDVAYAVYQRAEGINRFDINTLAGQAILDLGRGLINAARQKFESVLKKDPEHVPALLGKARLLFMDGKYGDALFVYKSIFLNTCRVYPATIRIAMGHCYMSMRKFDMARKCFARMLQLDGGCRDARIALAILDLYRRPDEDKVGPSRVEEALQNLNIAYLQDMKLPLKDRDPVVVNHLANSALLAKNYSLCSELAEEAVDIIRERMDDLMRVSETPSTSTSSLSTLGPSASPTSPITIRKMRLLKIRAETRCLIARSLHAEEKFREAFQYYSQAVADCPDFPLAQIGLGKVNIWKKDFTKAIFCFQKAITSLPESWELYRSIALLYHSLGQTDKSLEYYRKIPETKYGLDQLLEMADILAGCREISESLRLLVKYEKRTEISGNTVPYSVLNNLGALSHILGKKPDALKYYERAIAAAPSQVPSASCNVTTYYNRSLCLEDLHQFEASINIYKEILQNHPNYVDCYLRLAALYLRLGDRHAAARWLGDAILMDQDYSNAWAMLGNVHLLMEEWKPAQGKFNKIIRATNKHDQYANLQSANMYLILAHKTIDEKEKFERNLKMAQDIFYKFTSLNAGSIYAAHGLACCLALRREFDQARIGFQRVRECITSIKTSPCVWINLGHVALKHMQHEQAVAMYQRVQGEVYFGNNVELMLYCARAYVESKKDEQARKMLQRAIHMCPGDPLLNFNLGFVLFNQSERVVQQKSDVASRTLDDLEQALAFCTSSVKFIQYAQGVKRRSEFNKGMLRQEMNIDPRILKGLALRAKAQIGTVKQLVDIERKKQKDSDGLQNEFESVKEEALRLLREKHSEEEDARRKHEEDQILALEMKRKLEEMKRSWN